MCNASRYVLYLLKEIVEEFVIAKKSFTAFDITKEARVRTTEDVYHNEVKHKIHQFITDTISTSGNQYSIRQHDVYPALLYEPIDSPVVQQPVVDQGSNVSTVYTRDNRRRLCLRKKDLQVLKVTPNDTVRCYSAGIVTVDSLPSLKQIGTYTVDTYGNVRITSSILSQMGINDTQQNVTVTQTPSLKRLVLS